MNIWHIVSAYLPWVWMLVVGMLISQVSMQLYEVRGDLSAFFRNEVSEFTMERPLALDLGWKTMAIAALGLRWLIQRDKPVYLIDFACFEPPASWKLSPEQLLEIMRNQGTYTEDSLTFQKRILERSGCGPATAWPPAIARCLDKTLELQGTVDYARKESEVVMFDVVRRALQSTGTNAKDVDIIIVNCSLFSPTPSLCSMIIDEFNMRHDICSYNLSGMGCSAGVVSIELAKKALSSMPNSVALVVSTENLTQNLYRGNERSFLVQNTLFRCGGAAMVLSNKWTDGMRASFKLLTLVRTQYRDESKDPNRARLDSFKAVYETTDPTGERGVQLSKDITLVAGRAMEKNLTTLGPYVLPLSEQIKTVFSMMKCYMYKGSTPKVTPYIPDFKRGIDHFCIHAGGRSVIDTVEKNLKLTKEHAAPSRHALYTYGNTSSSSIWYEMDYVRKQANLRRGQRVLQVAFGSGFKCNSCVWLCINPGNHTNQVEVKEKAQ
jgi:3-ketoacyl-CoA synthase